ncbi:hypothetical protein [Thermaurantiacus sp.]
MREILVSVDVFAAIWALRRPGEQTENDVLRRILGVKPLVADSNRGLPVENPSARLQERSALDIAPTIDDHLEGKSSELKGRVETFGGEVGMGKVRWVDDIHKAFYDLGGRASLHAIYKHVAAQRRAAGRSVPKTLEATIRRTIEDHSSDSANFRGVDLFAKVGRGEWALRTR